ncbi:MAG: hypothetical protein ACRC35_10205 [Angustibacter sp.]
MSLSRRALLAGLACGGLVACTTDDEVPVGDGSTWPLSNSLTITAAGAVAGMVDRAAQALRGAMGVDRLTGQITVTRVPADETAVANWARRRKADSLLVVSEGLAITAADATPLARMAVTLTGWWGVFGPAKMSREDQRGAVVLLGWVRSNPQWPAVLAEQGWSDGWLTGQSLVDELRPQKV